MNQRKLFLSKAVLTLMMTILTMVTSVRVLSVVSAQEQSAPAGEMFATRPRIDVPVSLPLEEAGVIIDAAVGGAGQNKPRALPKRVEHVGGRNPPDSRRHTADHQ